MLLALNLLLVIILSAAILWTTLCMMVVTAWVIRPKTIVTHIASDPEALRELHEAVLKAHVQETGRPK